MYELTGIIVFWMIRITSIIALIYFIIDFNRFRESITRTVRTSNNTFKHRSLTIKEGIKELPWQAWLIFIAILIIGFFSWYTLFIF